MKQLTKQQRIQVVGMMVEGNSVRSIVRMTGIAKATVLKLLVDMGAVCAKFHDETVRGIKAKRIQADEIWAFVGAKRRAVEQGSKCYGDSWTWIAMDSDTKLCISYLVSDRGGGAAWEFMSDLAGRVVGHPQLTTDGHAAYLDAVIDNFGACVDYGQLVKIYGNDPRGNASPEARYSPGSCIGAKPYARIGTPDVRHISTSHIERLNLSVRTNVKRFARLTLAHSKIVTNHQHAVALTHGRGEAAMSYNAKAVANFFIDAAESEHQQLTPMKVLKLVYYAHGWHLGITDTPLINESVQAWRWGPVIYSLFTEFRDFGDQPITRHATEFVADQNGKLRLVPPSIPAEDERTRSLLARIWKLYGCYSAIQLSNATHEVGGPWHQVVSQYSGGLPRGATIPTQLIRDYFHRQALANKG